MQAAVKWVIGVAVAVIAGIVAIFGSDADAWIGGAMERARYALIKRSPAQAESYLRQLLAKDAARLAEVQASIAAPTRELQKLRDRACELKSQIAGQLPQYKLARTLQQEATNDTVRLPSGATVTKAQLEVDADQRGQLLQAAANELENVTALAKRYETLIPTWKTQLNTAKADLRNRSLLVQQRLVEMRLACSLTTVAAQLNALGGTASPTERALEQIVAVTDEAKAMNDTGPDQSALLDLRAKEQVSLEQSQFIGQLEAAIR
jgi:hypothetical protein